jgi:hypothetical protein
MISVVGGHVKKMCCGGDYGCDDTRSRWSSRGGERAMGMTPTGCAVWGLGERRAQGTWRSPFPIRFLSKASCGVWCVVNVWSGVSGVWRVWCEE